VRNALVTFCLVEIALVACSSSTKPSTQGSIYNPETTFTEDAADSESDDGSLEGASSDASLDVIGDATSGGDGTMGDDGGADGADDSSIDGPDSSDAASSDASD
jgi:hypothetical protein